MGHQHVYSVAEKPLLFAQTAAILEVFSLKSFDFYHFWRCPFDFYHFLRNPFGNLSKFSSFCFLDMALYCMVL